MKAKLFCKTGPLKGTSCTVGREATIGKDSANTLPLSPDLLSRKHARIFFDDAQKCYLLEDLKSRNGTWLDGSRVTQREKLHTLHIITFANRFDFIFQVIDDAAATPKATDATVFQTRLIAMMPVASPDADAGDRTQIGGEKTLIMPLGRPPVGPPAAPPAGLGGEPASDATVRLPTPSPTPITSGQDKSTNGDMPK